MSMKRYCPEELYTRDDKVRKGGKVSFYRAYFAGDGRN